MNKRSVLNLGLALICLSQAESALARTGNTGDNFNDNLRDSVKWGSAVAWGNGILSEINGRVEYTAAQPTEEEDESYWPWQGSVLPQNQDWFVQVTLGNTAPLPNSETLAAVGLTVSKESTFEDLGIIAELYASRFDSPSLTRGLVTDLETPQTGIIGSRDLPSPNATRATIRLRHQQGAKVISVEYDMDGPENGLSWTRLASYGVAGSGGATANANFNMTANENYKVLLYGFSEGGVAVAPGQIWADDFIVYVGNEPSPIVSATRSGGNIEIAWPQTHRSYKLQESVGLGSWSDAPQAISFLNGNFKTTIPVGAENKFFRLIAVD